MAQEVLTVVTEMNKKLDRFNERLLKLERNEDRRLAVEEYKQAHAPKPYPPMWTTKEGKALIGAITAVGMAIASYITLRGGL